MRVVEPPVGPGVVVVGAGGQGLGEETQCGGGPAHALRAGHLPANMLADVRLDGDLVLVERDQLAVTQSSARGAQLGRVRTDRAVLISAITSRTPAAESLSPHAPRAHMRLCTRPR